MDRHAIRNQRVSFDEKALSRLQIQAHIDDQFGIFLQGLFKF